jgi:serine/threonine-protein kinase
MDRYVPTGETDAGGIGTVVFCTDTNLDRTVAIKYLEDGGDHTRLLDELNALQRIRSKHVVRVLDVVYENPAGASQMGIVLEFISGQSVADVLGQIAADGSFVRLVYQIACGIADIHDVNVIHRDIKPLNMKVDDEQILKIIDFNLARDVKEGKTHGFRGTRGYAAPELYSDAAVTFGQEIDVYALGVTAWALLHGTRLPDRLRALPPDPGGWKAGGAGFVALNTGIDSNLMTLLDEAISVRPADRPSAREIAERAGRVLTRGKHRGTLVVFSDGTRYVLSNAQPAAPIKTNFGSATISYDSMDFVLSSVSGEVWVNNMRAHQGMRLPGGCVLTFGDPPRRNTRTFVTLDISHPQVVL